MPNAMAGAYEALYAIERQIVTVKVNADGSSEKIEELTTLLNAKLKVARHDAEIMIKTQGTWTDGLVVCQTAFNIFNQTARIFASCLSNNPHTTGVVS
jgi:hypothetical protein